MRRILGIGSFVALVVAAFAGTWQQNMQASGMSNAKQIAIGMIMYTTDYDDLTPWVQDTATAQVLTYPYIKNIAVWKTQNPAASVFEYNLTAGGVRTDKMENPATLVMYFESKPWEDGSRIVAYWDGHVRLASTADWSKISSSMKTKLKRAAKKPLPKMKPKF